ncbi:ABC transporter permease [Mesorhizobium sp. M1C.F.Ca.ET.193.01.1.1]|uniref:ABC transporter permease n=1 Tax=unclassified Mesorhizobium TaxID=325217 RepID=UPI000FD42BAF|nr:MULTISPECIES: ABC transporter permease [unclassified Mesorhizobium]TGT03283.1 ABC transporter permease [bacterium M00.F.Ca.ET.177.01.1.1]TGQ55962.1 ABC transporter permease [Mesorhizobium sp. M1C.F.Ca.ET.210.01.1.1]TGQ75047.1 ABC transporter permease [Mesorhizobium sp. M1C.F.Ca.ET.212.01.1.1]TGR13459.1 ABC transporter permease [Mesorhizobium sp. M1C.F.Ca.ET.204.01.1.1]TGR33735.1 ABC transporter permease [Mesorhizobium sp. M1C.F.Ca.ET.196.01.1.1]
MASASQIAEKAERDDIRSRWLLSALALLIVLLAAVGPLLIVVVYSFLTPGNYGDVKWQFSTDAWVGVLFERDVFDDTLSIAGAHLSILWRSASLSVLTTILTVIFGFPTAYFIATRPEHRREIWLFLITIPFWTNLLIRTFAMQEVLRNDGIINSALQLLRVTDHPVQFLYTNVAVLLGMVYVFLPLMVLPLYASMEKIDFRLVEAGYDLYATRFQVLRHIIIPLVTPGIVAGSILVFIPSLGAYVTPRVLGGGTNLMIGNLIELQFGQGRNWPLGAALSIALMAIVMVALLVYVRNTSRPNGGHG